MSNEPTSTPLESIGDSHLIPAVSDAAKDLTAAVREEAREIATLAGDQALLRRKF